MHNQEIIDLYNDLARHMWQRLVELVGVHTLRVLVNRAHWTTCQKYAEATVIELNDEGVFFRICDAKADADKIKIFAEEFFGSLVSILTRLIGEDISSKVAREIDLIRTSGGL